MSHLDTTEYYTKNKGPAERGCLSYTVKQRERHKKACIIECSHILPFNYDQSKSINTSICVFVYIERYRYR